jgi:hypothetical protein
VRVGSGAKKHMTQEKKQKEVMEKINKILEEEGMTLTVSQLIQVIPKPKEEK